jgi:hypothetical protein
LPPRIVGRGCIPGAASAQGKSRIRKARLPFQQLEN